MVSIPYSLCRNLPLLRSSLLRFTSKGLHSTNRTVATESAPSHSAIVVHDISSSCSCLIISYANKGPPPSYSAIIYRTLLNPPTIEDNRSPTPYHKHRSTVHCKQNTSGLEPGFAPNGCEASHFSVFSVFPPYQLILLPYPSRYANYYMNTKNPLKLTLHIGAGLRPCCSLPFPRLCNVRMWRSLPRPLSLSPFFSPLPGISSGRSLIFFPCPSSTDISQLCTLT